MHLRIDPEILEVAVSVESDSNVVRSDKPSATWEVTSAHC